MNFLDAAKKLLNFSGSNAAKLEERGRVVAKLRDSRPQSAVMAQFANAKPTGFAISTDARIDVALFSAAERQLGAKATQNHVLTAHENRAL